MNGTKSHLKVLAAVAMLTAISIVCGKYLAINLGNVIRISFENLPIIFAGMAFGPVSGILCGVSADLIGCILVGYGINPLVTIGAAAIGLISGVVPRIFKKLPLSISVLLTVLLSHVVGSVLIKTVGLAAYYDMPIYVLMLWRALNYLLVGVADGALVYVLLRNKMLKKQLISLKSGAKNATRGGTNDKNEEKTDI